MTGRVERALGNLLDLNLDLVDVKPESRYFIAGVYGFGRGVFGRGPIAGADTKYTRLNRLHADRLVMSRLKAFEGAVAIVPQEFDGWYLSPEFPTFRCVEGELDPRYMANVCRWQEFWARLAGASKGIGARRERVHPEQLLKLRLQVPPIDEQKLLGARLDGLFIATERLKSQSTKAAQLADALSVSICARPDLSEVQKTALGWRHVPLGSVMAPASDRVPVDAEASYSNLGIYSFGLGVFDKPRIDGAATSATTLNCVSAGQFIYSRLFAFEGAYAFVPKSFDGYYVSNEFPTFDPDPDQLDARWLATYLRSPSRWSELAGASKGLGVRRQRIPSEAVLAFRVWLPPVDQQQSIVVRLERLDATRNAQAESLTRVDSLVPAALNDAFSD